MGLINQVQLLDSIHYRIEHKRTGNPENFASKLGVSQSKLYRILAELRDIGIEIKYENSKSSYVYIGEKKIDSLLKELGLTELRF